MTPRASLGRRITLGMLGYAALLSVAVFAHGFFVNETAEKLVWQSLLHAELDYFLRRSEEDPSYRWPGTETMELYAVPLGDSLPGPLGTLAPGLHDEVRVDERDLVVLIRDTEDRRIVLALDISDLERQERRLIFWIALSFLTVVLLLAVAVAWGMSLLVRPLRELAEGIRSLRPDEGGQRLAVADSATSELVVIADAVNGYLQRNEKYVERERTFVHAASHELRTPIAVMAGAADLALAQPGVPDAARVQLDRIRGTARNIEQLVSLLLMLARDPGRLKELNDRIELDQLLPEIVDDHRHLCGDKDLELDLQPPPRCELLAPIAVVQAVVGNLLRNAIENSDRGQISIVLQPAGVVEIEDPGHRMPPEEVSRIYARVVRGQRSVGGGIGLELIARLCEHLGWSLDISAGTDGGTRIVLNFAASVVRSSVSAPTRRKTCSHGFPTCPR